MEICIMGKKIVEVNGYLLRYICPDDWSVEQKEENSIDARKIVEAINAGKTIEIINAVIKGPFILRSANVESEITIKRTKIKGPLDWSYSTFKQVLNLEGSIFETDAIFTAITIEKDAFFKSAIFMGEAKFLRARIYSAGVFIEAVFEKLANFNGVLIEGDAFFNPVIFKGDADFASAQIGSGAEFTEAVFKQKANFNSIHIKGVAFFNSATFKCDCEDECDCGANFIGARIGSNAEFTKAVFRQKANFNSIHIKGVAFFNPAFFKGEADFISARIGSNAEFTGARFRQKASFNSSQIEGFAIFKLAFFKGEADFASARIGSNAEFTGAQFRQKVLFNRVQIEGVAFFNPAFFKGEADFISARIGSDGIFTGAVFEQKANFNSSQIEGAAFFELAIFKGEANFVSARIGSNAEFTGVVFRQKVKFNRAQIEGAVFFDQAHLFSWDEGSEKDLTKFISFLKNNFDIEWIETPNIETKFDDRNTIEVTTKNNRIVLILNDKKPNVLLKIDDDRTYELIVEIEGGKLNIGNPVTFECEADFTNVRIGSNVKFNGTKFNGKAIFDNAQFESESHFENAIFNNKISLQDTFFRIIYFGEPNVQFVKKIDLRGCTYDRIHPILFWEQLIEHLDPYDRQPFAQLENTFRLAGDDKLANKVYYRGMQQRSKKLFKIKKCPLTWMLDRLHCWFTGYGVRTVRLLRLIVPILIIGTLTFHLEGSVVLMPNIQSLSMVNPHESVWESVWVSLNIFLPIDIPSGASWQPSSLFIPKFWIIPEFMRFTTFATLLNLAGWILVPVGVAGISGLLKRSK